LRETVFKKIGILFSVSLRWYYPDQVPGVDGIMIILSARFFGLPQRNAYGRPLTGIQNRYFG